MLEVTRQAGVGANIGHLRMAGGLTLDRLAASSQLTRGYVSLVERGLKVPSMAALLRIATVLEVNVADLFEPQSSPAPRYTLFRQDDRNGSSSNGSGLELLAIATGLKRKMMEPFLLSPPLKAAPLASHGGEEVLFVVDGRIAVRFDGEELALSKRNCLYFSGETPHEVRSIGRQKARVLLVVAQGQTRTP